MKQNILVVDDHRENLVALEAILDRDDRQLVMARSGNEALSMALKHDFAVVLLDVQMPDMDGFEVAELMRKNKKTQHLPIIFVTAISKEHKYVFKGYQCGAVDYLFKPIDQQVLEAKVGVFLELDRQRRKLQQAVVQMKRLKDQNERLLQALGEAVIGTNANGEVTFCNEAATGLLGESSSVLTGQGLDRLLFYDELGNLRWSWGESPLFRACGQNGQAWQNRHSLYMKSREGLVPIRLRADPVLNDAGQFAGIVAVLRQDLAADEDQTQREHRHSRRKKMYCEMVVFDRGTGGNLGRLVNLGAGGFKLYTRREMQPGKSLHLGMVLPDQIAGVNTMTFEARVVWCEPRDAEDEYQAGFKFLDLNDTCQAVVETLMEKY